MCTLTLASIINSYSRVLKGALIQIKDTKGNQMMKVPSNTSNETAEMGEMLACGGEGRRSHGGTHGRV